MYTVSYCIIAQKKYVLILPLDTNAGTNIEIYLRTFNASVLAFKLQVFLHSYISFLSFIFLILCNKFVSIWKTHSSSTVLNDVIN